MTSLRTCDACSRHVFVTETRCPFCNAPLAPAAPRTLGQRLRRGMSRAQLLAVAAAVSSQALGGCTDTPQNDGVAANGGTTAGTSAGAGEAGEGGAGAGGEGGSTGGTGGTAGTDGGAGGDMMGGPVYGAPITPDAGPDASADAEVDAAADSGEDPGDDMMVMPLYGGSPDPVPND